MRSAVCPAREMTSPSSPWLKKPSFARKFSSARTRSMGVSAPTTVSAARAVSSSGTLLGLGIETLPNGTSASCSSSGMFGITASTVYSSPFVSFVVETAVPVSVFT